MLEQRPFAHGLAKTPEKQVHWKFAENGFSAAIFLTIRPITYTLPDRTITIPAGIPIAQLDLTPAGIFWPEAKNRTFVLAEGIRTFGLFLREIDRRSEEMQGSMRPHYLFGYTHENMSNFAGRLGFTIISHPQEVGADRIIGRLEDIQRTFAKLKETPGMQKLLARAPTGGKKSNK